MKQYIGYCSGYQLKEMFLRFYTDADESSAIEFCNAVHQLNLPNVSPAQIQGHFLIYKDSCRDALENVRALVPKIK